MSDTTSAATSTHIDLTDVRIGALDDAALASLREGLRGEVVTPGDPEYDEARTVWNGMIDRRPAAIVRCRGAADVMRAARFASERDLPLAVRGGGHNIAGNAVGDGAVVADLSEMRSVRVDPARRTARVEAGCTLADLDHETQAFGLALPVGINSTTGIAGLTLGGGYGWLSRAYGMTIDNLLSADVVTPAGEMVHASPDEEPDLFWALRGGGGNFGIVTSFEFALHPVGPTVLAGLIVHPFEHAADVLRRYREFAAEAPEETAVWVVLRKAPPLPFLPEEWHGREVVVLAACHAGAVEDGERALAPLREFGEPIADVIGPQPYEAWQQAFDPLLTPGARNYWKSHNFAGLSDELIDTLVDRVRTLPTPQCEAFIAHLGGAIGRVDAGATAYPHRDAEFVLNVHTRWDDATQDDACVAWAREAFRATGRYATGGVYVNFMPDDEGDRVGAAYGENYPRLRELKLRMDPDNRLRFNQNIRPAGMA